MPENNVKFPLKVKIALYTNSGIMICDQIVSAGNELLKVEGVEFVGLDGYKINGTSFIDRCKIIGFSKLENKNSIIPNKPKFKLVMGGKN